MAAGLQHAVGDLHRAVRGGHERLGLAPVVAVALPGAGQQHGDCGLRQVLETPHQVGLVAAPFAAAEEVPGARVVGRPVVAGERDRRREHLGVAHRQLEGAVAAGGVAHERPGPRVGRDPVGRLDRRGHVLGEVRLGLRGTRDVLALGVPGQRRRGGHQHQHGRLHPPLLEQLQRRARVVEAGDEVLGDAGEAGADDQDRELLLLVLGLEVLRRQVDVPIGGEPGGGAVDADLADLAGLVAVAAERAAALHLGVADGLDAQPAGGVHLVVDDHRSAVPGAQQVVPAAVEREVVVGDQPERGEHGQLGGDQGTDPAEDGLPVPLRQSRPQPDRPDHRRDGDQNGQCQHLVARQTHVVFAPTPRTPPPPGEGHPGGPPRFPRPRGAPSPRRDHPA